MDVKDVRFKNICTSLPVLVPENVPHDLVLKILAAVTSYSLGVKSMDKTLERYGSTWLAQLEAKEQNKGGTIH